MKKSFFILVAFLLIGFIAISFKGAAENDKNTKLVEDLKSLAQVERNNIPPEPSDFELYRSKNFGFTMNVPKIISVYEGVGENETEKDDEFVVKENSSKGIVYLMAKSDESIITSKGEVLSEPSTEGPVFLSTLFIRPLEKWKDINSVLEELIKQSAPGGTPLQDVKLKSLDRHPGSTIYTAIFGFSAADESGTATEHLLPVNFKAVFSSEFKKVALWLVTKDYMFGHTVSGSTYKVFDDAIFDSLTFVE